jgi:hypothetical protein
MTKLSVQSLVSVIRYTVWRIYAYIAKRRRQGNSNVSRTSAVEEEVHLRGHKKQAHLATKLKSEYEGRLAVRYLAGSYSQADWLRRVDG